MVCTGQIDSSGQTESSDEGGRRGGMSAYVSVLKSTKSYKIQQSQIQFHGELCFAGHQHPLNEGGEAPLEVPELQQKDENGRVIHTKLNTFKTEKKREGKMPLLLFSFLSFFVCWSGTLSRDCC